MTNTLIRDAVRMTPGTVQDLYVGFDLPSGDSISNISNVTVTTSTADLTTANRALNNNNVVIRNTTYTAGQAVGYDVSYAGSIVGGALSGYIDFAYTSVGGTIQKERVPVEIVAAVEANFSDSPATVMTTNFEIVVGIAVGATDLGAFPSATIPAGQSVKGAITHLLNAHDGLATTVTGHTATLATKAGLTTQNNLITLTGRPADSTNLGAFTTASYRDSSTPAIGSTATAKSALQSMATHIDQLNVFNVLHYGADPTGASDSRAAIQAAIDAAYAKRQSISSSTSSSINDQLQSPVYFPKGTYRIDGPLVRSDHCVHLIGDRAVLTAGATFHTNHPYGWALELGEQTTNTAMVDTIIKGITFTEFRRHIRMGNARNNVNLGRIFVENCKFIGRYDYPTLSVRIYNRSADAVFYRCTWDVIDVAIDVQSCDKVAVYDCRIQLGTYHEWAANYAGKVGGGGYAAGDVVYAQVGGVWRLYERVVTGGSPEEATFGPAQTPADNSKWTYLQDVDAYTGVFRLNRGRLLISNFVGNPILIGYTRSNPYSWVLAQDYSPWAASRGYIEGDMIAQAYGAGGNENVFWARKTGQDGTSGASWDATERNKWLICGAPTYEADPAKATYVTNDVVRVSDVSFYRATTSTSGVFDTGLAAGDWELIETVSAPTASDSISVWTSVKVIDECFFGAEGADNGMGLVTWNASDRLTANGKQANLKSRYISECVVRDSYLASGRKVGTEELVPAVLLVKLPQTLIVKDNMWNDDYKCVAAAYRTGATPPTRPGPNESLNSRRNCFRTDISGNYGGGAGTVLGSTAETLYRDFSPNWAPDELLAITLPQYGGATSNPVLGEGHYFVAANASAVEHNAFINTTEGKQFTVRFQSPIFAVTGVASGDPPTDVLTAAGHNFVNGDVVRFTALAGGTGLFTVVNYFVIDRNGDTFRLSATSGGSAVDFTSNLTAGSFIYRVKSQHTLKHEPNYLYLRDNRNVNPPANSWMTFEVRNGAAWETSRSFDGKFFSVTPGSGIPGGNAYRATVEWRHDLIYTRIYIDLGEGFRSGGTADDAIGTNGAANAHIGRILNTDVGTIIAGRMYILETPAGGDTDIDLLASGSGTVAQDAAVISPTRLVNSGTWAAGDTKALTALPSNLQYLYLAGQTPTQGTYTAGQVMIELIGTL